MGGVNVALARMEYQQKVNQLNLSNTLNNRQANNRTMMSREGDSEDLPNQSPLGINTENECNAYVYNVKW